MQTKPLYKVYSKVKLYISVGLFVCFYFHTFFCYQVSFKKYFKRIKFNNTLCLILILKYNSSYKIYTLICLRIQLLHMYTIKTAFYTFSHTINICHIALYYKVNNKSRRRKRREWATTELPTNITTLARYVCSAKPKVLYWNKIYVFLKVLSVYNIPTTITITVIILKHCLMAVLLVLLLLYFLWMAEK